MVERFASEMIGRVGHRFKAKADAVLLTIDTRLERILAGWIAIAGSIATLRLIAAPHNLPVTNFENISAYILLVAAPVISTLLALRWFRNGHRQAQPVTRLARAGRWTGLDRNDAEAHRLYGTGGIMVSLLVGMMINVPLRGAEYLAGMPPIPANAPDWLSALHFAMTLDVVLFSSLYMVAFVAALRRVPLFPRLLVAIWLADLAMKLFTANFVIAAGGLPEAVGASLQGLLEGNMKKTVISMVIWLPYLLLSTRVNVTYRHRVPA